MRKLFRSIFLFINVLCIACALMTYWGSGISPDRFVLPAYLALAFPFVLFANVCFVVFWLAFRKWYFVLSLALLIGSYTKIRTCFPLNYKQAKQAEQNGAFTVMTYNTWLLGGLKKHTEKNPNKVLQHILDSDADIVCMQEFGVSNKLITEGDVRRILKKYPYKQIYYKVNRSYKRMGIATFSKYPIIRKETIEFPSKQNEAIFSDIVIGKDTIRLFNCHLESNKLTEKDKAMPAELRKNFDAENLSNVTLHLSRKLGSAYKARSVQADMVSEYISRSPYKTVVCGDFNDVPLSYSYTKIRGDMQDAFESLGFGLGITFNEDFYRFRIDYVLCDSHFIPLQLKRDKVPYSDHYPITCTLKIAE